MTNFAQHVLYEINRALHNPTASVTPGTLGEQVLTQVFAELRASAANSTQHGSAPIALANVASPIVQQDPSVSGNYGSASDAKK